MYFLTTLTTSLRGKRVYFFKIYKIKKNTQLKYPFERFQVFRTVATI